MGKTELCLEIFGCIEKYIDVNETYSTGINKKRKVENAEDLAQTLQSQAVAFDLAVKSRLMKGAPVLMPQMSDKSVQDREVAAHLL